MSRAPDNTTQDRRYAGVAYGRKEGAEAGIPWAPGDWTVPPRRCQRIATMITSGGNRNPGTRTAADVLDRSDDASSYRAGAQDS
ncbi:MAG: hypothetical protein JO287_02795 [Pseudonocardiales bacterium]|nr:hypothetical protein [Pseudonocardiales bacterium]